jgi:small subunit ribosomal protein S6
LAENVYECLFILDSNRYARDASGVAATIPEMIEKLGGEVLANRLWIEQKLAYPIEGHRKGVYWLTYFRLSSLRLTEFNRSCQLNEAVVRHLVLKLEPRLVEILVSHARGERIYSITPATDDDETADASPLGEGAEVEIRG